ncbi:MAG: bpX6 domain-containing protein [Sandaracinus sp.]
MTPTLFHGSHEATGLVVGGLGTREAARRARVIALWEPGARVHAIDADRLVVRFATARRMRSEHAPGMLLVAAHGISSTSPLAPGWLAEREVPREGIVIAEAGRLVVRTPTERDACDPADWIDLSGVHMKRAAPLGPEPAPAVVPTSAATSARDALGDHIPSREGVPDSLAAIAGDAALPPAGPTWWERLWGTWRGIGRFAGGGSEHAGSTSLVGPGRSWLASLRTWLDGLVLRSRLGRLLARRQAEYVTRLLTLLDGDDLHEALRWAIPLADRGAASAGAPTLATPTPRTSLALRGSRGAPTTALGIGGLYDLLRARYVTVAQKLQVADRIDEAAFVLAELLRDAAAAVALLERHRRFAEAARLADAYRLPAATRARAWILAGDAPRALRIARRDGDVGVVLAMLRRSRPDLADVLARAWAEDLARAGDFVTAIATVEGIADAEARIREWIERGLGGHDAAAADLLARRIGLAPERWQDSRARALALIDDDADPGGRALLTFAAALLRHASGVHGRVISRAVTRAVVRGCYPTTPHDLIQRLQAHANDGALRVDVVRGSLARAKPERLVARASPLVVRVDESDVGTLRVADAAWLPSRRVLVALGEAGARLQLADGRVRCAFDAPTDALVVADAGTRALAVGRTDSFCRLTRLDLLDGRRERWWEAPLASFARTFDGTSWLVNERGGGKLIDVLDPGWTALDAVHDERCVIVERSGRQLVVLVARNSGLELFVYGSTLGRLERRLSLEVPEGARVHRLTLGGREPWALLEGAPGAPPTAGATLARLSPQGLVQTPVDGAPCGTGLVSNGEQLAVAMRMSRGVRVDLLTTGGRSLLHVLLDGARDVSVRLTLHALTVADDRGRVLVLDTWSGELLASLRAR